VSEHHEAAINATTPETGRSGFRPGSVAAVSLATIAEALGIAAPDISHDKGVTGITLNSRAVEAGDLYMALPGAARHGADFVPQAIDAGAVAVVTDDAGARQLALSGEQPVPVLVSKSRGPPSGV
jgi:UDP-N-acetylmuramoyl-L-alanyl-D-glutamate--2,6-diaminopimelate ligase